jgi:hypothetical protein
VACEVENAAFSLHDSFAGGDKLVETESNQPYVYSLAFATQDGKKRVLLVNKRDRPFDVVVTGAAGGRLDYVDQTTSFQPPAMMKLSGDTLKVGGYSVAVVTLP